ncbi:Chymotrypsinogen B, partial [Brachionus plicatilis]
LNFSQQEANILENIVEQIDEKKFQLIFDSLNLPSVKTKNWTNDQKIINGQPVMPGAFPFMVSLGMFSPNSYRHRCGGTIVRRQYVVTAAHCVSDVGQSYNPTLYFQENNQALSVIAGTEIISGINFLNLFENQNIYLVRRIFINPNYNNSINPNDIAILAIDSMLNFSPLVFSVTIPSTLDPSAIFGQTVTTLGWGVNELGGLSSQLMSTTLTVLNGTPLQSSCQGYDNDYYCVQDLSGTSSNVCFGDSGGSLVSFEKNRWTFYGITSFVFVDSNGNCLNTAPSFFAMVPRLSNWLNGHISN